jgi:hypothetical protein
LAGSSRSGFRFHSFLSSGLPSLSLHRAAMFFGLTLSLSAPGGQPASPSFSFTPP